MWWGLRGVLLEECNYWKLLHVISLTHTHMDAHPPPILYVHTHTHTGGDICEVCAALHCPGPAPGGAELPSYCHPPWDASGGEVSQRWGRCFVSLRGKETLESEESQHFSAFLSHKGFLGISSLKIFNDEFLWLPTCLAEAWTLSGWTLPLTTTCLRILTPTCIG